MNLWLEVVLVQSSRVPPGVMTPDWWELLVGARQLVPGGTP